MIRNVMIAVVVAMAAGSAGAQEFLYANNSGGQFIRINTSNAQPAQIRAGTPWQGMGYNPFTQTLYAYSGTQVFSRNINDGTDALLFSENTPATTGMTVAGPQFNRFFAIQQGAAAAYEWDSNGNQVRQLTLISGAMLDMATDVFGNLYYAEGFSNGNVWRLDPDTNQSTLVYSGGTGGNGGFTAIGFDSQNTLFGVTISNDRLLRLDLNNNTFVDVGQVSGFGDVRSMTGLIPAPGAAAVLGLGGLAALRRRR